MRKFLQTFASQSGTPKYVPMGVNGSNMFMVEWLCTSAVAAAETVTLTLPAGISIEKPISGADTPCPLPIKATAFSMANPRVKVVEADLLITSFDQDTNVLVLTAAGGGVPNGASIVVLFGLSTLRTA